MGAGDLMLLAAIGAFEGPQKTLGTLVIGSVLGAIVGSALIFNKKLGLKDQIQFGPFLAIAAYMNLVLTLSWLNSIFMPF